METAVQLRGVYYGEIIRKYRTYQGLSQRDLAERVSLSPPQISQIENGVHQPTPVTLGRIASALGVTTAHLMGEVPFLSTWPEEDST